MKLKSIIKNLTKSFFALGVITGVGIGLGATSTTNNSIVINNSTNINAINPTTVNYSLKEQKIHTTGIIYIIEVFETTTTNLTTSILADETNFEVKFEDNTNATFDIEEKDIIKSATEARWYVPFNISNLTMNTTYKTTINTKLGSTTDVFDVLVLPENTTTTKSSSSGHFINQKIHHKGYVNSLDNTKSTIYFLIINSDTTSTTAHIESLIKIRITINGVKKEYNAFVLN